MLWAALLFPQLPIDMQKGDMQKGDMQKGDMQKGDMQPQNAVAEDSDNQAEQPLAVIVQEGSQRLIMSSNSCARNRGIHPGLALNAAYAIAPDLHVVEYNEQHQQRHLEHLCLWALQYSSWVTPTMPDMILVEIEASLTLFGGLEKLIKRIRADSQAQGLLLQIGIAPTPTAANLFARVGGKTGVLTKERLLPVVGKIPTDYLPLDAFTLKGLRQSGIKHCEQLFQLPGAALTRRFGQPCTELIYKLLGKLPDVCPAFTLPKTFAQTLDLPLEAPSASALQFPLNRLLGALSGFLVTTDMGVKTLVVTLHHHRATATRVNISFLEATADCKHLFKVILERLTNTTLAEPATAMTMTTQELAPVARNDRDLFQKSQNQQTSVQQLFDSLSAKLGDNKLYTPMLSDDHRPEKAYPEKAWCSELKDRKTPPDDWPARPVWLLQQPIRADRSLVIRSTAERIENGWWGDTDVRRDYFIAADPQGVHFWVYKDRSTPDELFIHGIFS